MPESKKVLIIIPARYASTRYPAKPLVELKGATGQAKSLIRRSWEAALAVGSEYDVVVATDHEDIRRHAAAFGADVAMTSPDCRNGTERCAEVARQRPGYDVYVNLQGDAPLTPAWFVRDLANRLLEDSSCMMATPVLRCDRRALEGFLNDRRNGRVGGTTVVFSATMRAIYFSKEVLPFMDLGKIGRSELTPAFHHVGCYAYTAAALEQYAALPECELEKLEGLEQLRFLHYDIPVTCVEVDARGRHFWELNNPTDVQIVEKALAEAGIE